MINSTNPCTAPAEATTAAPPSGGSGGTGIRTGMSERVSQWPMSRGDECWKLLGKRIRAVYVGQVAHCQPLQCANFLKLQRFSGPVANSFPTLFALRPRLYTWPCFCSVGGGKPPVLQPPPPSLKRRRKPSKKSHPYKEFACVCQSRLKAEVLQESSPGGETRSTAKRGPPYTGCENAPIWLCIINLSSAGEKQYASLLEYQQRDETRPESWQETSALWPGAGSERGARAALTRPGSRLVEQYDDKFWPPVKESILKTHTKKLVSTPPSKAQLGRLGGGIFYSYGTFSFTAEPDVFHFRVQRWALGCRVGLDSSVWTSNFEPREQIYTPGQHTLIHQLGPTLSGRLKPSQPCFEGGRQFILSLGTHSLPGWVSVWNVRNLCFYLLVYLSLGVSVDT